MTYVLTVRGRRSQAARPCVLPDRGARDRSASAKTSNTPCVSGTSVHGPRGVATRDDAGSACRRDAGRSPEAAIGRARTRQRRACAIGFRDRRRAAHGSVCGSVTPKSRRAVLRSEVCAANRVRLDTTPCVRSARAPDRSRRGCLRAAQRRRTHRAAVAATRAPRKRASKRRSPGRRPCGRRPRRALEATPTGSASRGRCPRRCPRAGRPQGTVRPSSLEAAPSSLGAILRHRFRRGCSDQSGKHQGESRSGKDVFVIHG